MKNLFCIFLIFIFSCSTTTVYKRPQTSEGTSTTQTASEKETLTPSAAQSETTNYKRPEEVLATEDSPASALIQEGISLFKEQKINEAEWKFEEAINVDPDYGPAYYWLARAKSKQGDSKDCSALLNKAETLLKKSPVWIERISKFREFLEK